ncbi:hypothetical protein V6N13_011452 [Hibiscus sabdariffa]
MFSLERRSSVLPMFIYLDMTTGVAEHRGIGWCDDVKC